MSWPSEDSSSPNLASTSQEVLEPTVASSSSRRMLRVTLLADEWGSSKGGLSTINRELAKQLAKIPGVEVSLLVPNCSEQEKAAALSHGVALIEAQEKVGMEPVYWLSFPPKELHIDVVIGHGQKLGPPAQVIKQSHKCTWVHVVHTASEELAMFKIRREAISEGEMKQETEVQLCLMADSVVAIGPKLKEAISAHLRPYRKDVFDLTPGIFQEFCHLQQAAKDLGNFRVLVFGQGDSEDFELKGYDIAAQAVAELKDPTYNLIFVGAPNGKEEEVKENLLKHGISQSQLTVRSFRESREKLADLFLEADLAIMPSRTEGFGLTALEALSAGLPILVSGNSGFGEALKKVPFGQHYIVDSEDAKVWAKKIKQVREKDREGRLTESQTLRTSYATRYDWQRQCKALVEKMQSITDHGGELGPAGRENGSLPHLDTRGTGGSDGSVGDLHKDSSEEQQRPTPQKKRSLLTPYTRTRPQDTVKKGTPSDEELERVAEEIGDSWKSLGRRLKFSEAPMTAFHKENEHYSEKAYKMLLAWKNRYGQDATYQELYVALHHRLVARRDLASKFCCDGGSIPLSILARGEEGIAAYQRALELGWTFDKRVKVLLVGQDRVGKTSVGRTLRGEKFNENEPSTEGVLMNKPLKNVGQQAWQNSELHKYTSAYDYKCAEYVSRDLTRSRDQSVEGPTEEYTTTQTEDATTEPTGKPNSEQNKQPTQELHVPNTSAGEQPKDPIKKDPPMNTETGTAESTLNVEEHVPEQKKIVMPDQVVRLVENNLQEGNTDSGEGIWPVIWDFAGQAVYRAIHPIFLSRQTVYILVFDLRKKLSAKAQCCVKQDGRDEKEITTSDYNDTNLDHIMRWMDLIHSLKTVPEGLLDVASPHGSLPPVLMVGTHADSKDVNHKEKMNILMEKLRITKEFKEHIVDTFVVDNTRAGQPKDQEDPAVKDLRDVILKEANEMPYTKNRVPLPWLAVEKKISERASQGLKYVTKKEFKEKIANGIGRFEEENHTEVLLHFLHDRGSILYHERADNSDGLVVLDPQWLIKVLCEILKVEPEDKGRPIITDYRKDLETKGILAKELLDHACTKLGLVGIKGYLLDLMEKYNLLCSFKSKDEKEAYLVPCMVTARPDEQTTRTTSAALPPLFVTFKTKYVPCGLFPRLVLLFAKWAKLKCRFQPQLFANEAIFRVGKAHCLGFSCYKSVIKFFVWTQDDRSDPLEKELQCCLEVLRFLEKSLDKLCEECHWLHSCSWDLCIQCNLCRRIPDAKSGVCYWHDEKECFHDDCAHYVDIPLKTEPLCCYRLDNRLGALLPDREKFDPWIKAFTKLRPTKDQEKPETNSGHEVQPNSATEFPQVKEGMPSEEELEEVAVNIGDSWKSLGRRLKFNDAQITAFHKENEKYSEKAFRMLLTWKRTNGRNASYQVLYDALCHCLVSHADLATTFCCVERL